MSKDKSVNLEIVRRLERMREHLQVHPSPNTPAFEEAVIDVCRSRIEDILAGAPVRSGEEILGYVADSLQVCFEEVHNDEDIAALERKYLEDKGEIGFGQLEIELSSPDVDAILFQRMKASRSAQDRWVAVLNLRESNSRRYWNRAHELIHRVAEPPQYELAFHRHRNDKTNPLESLIDKVAGELAFFPRLFSPVVDSVNEQLFSWQLVDQVRERFAPSASRLSTGIAMLRHWPRAAYILKARINGRKRNPSLDVGLRVALQGRSSINGKGLFFYPNMRVPPTSPVWHCFHSGDELSGFEQLDNWVTSSGNGLPNMRSFTSAYKWRDCVYALVSPA